MSKLLAGKRILLTNDDGIYAPGLKVLEAIAHELSDDVWVVAPETEQSATSHSLTLHDPLRMRELSERRYAVKGTPTDCVMMAIKHLLKDDLPDLVLSGVNRGQNMAEDVTYSGTIAAAMEGILLGVPSIALSQVFGLNSKSPPWPVAEAHGAKIIARLVETGWPANVLLNVNFPDVEPDSVSGVKVSVQGRREQFLLNVIERTDGRNVPYYWFGFNRKRFDPPQGTDLHAVYNGSISVTPLHLDLTHGETVSALKGALE